VSPAGAGNECMVPGCSTSTAAVEQQEEKESSGVTSPQNISLSVGHQGSLPTTADTVQTVNMLSLHNIDLSYNSPRVSREPVESSGQAARSRSPSPLWSNDDSVHDADFDIHAKVELEGQRRH